MFRVEVCLTAKNQTYFRHICANKKPGPCFREPGAQLKTDNVIFCGALAFFLAWAL
jgi:hypothetical protein